MCWLNFVPCGTTILQIKHQKSIEPYLQKTDQCGNMSLAVNVLVCSSIPVPAGTHLHIHIRQLLQLIHQAVGTVFTHVADTLPKFSFEHDNGG